MSETAVEMSEADRQVQDASDRATWDAIEAYRDTGEMVPVERDGQLVFLTVDEALRARADYELRKRENAAWRRRNLVEQFKAAGIEITPDVWDRLEQDRRQALEDDLAWISRGREASCLSRPPCRSRQKRSSK